MAGRSVMEDGPKYLELPECDWMHGHFWGNMPLLYSAIKQHAGSSEPCFLSYEANHHGVMAAYVNATGAQPHFITLLRSPLSWVISAAEHWQRPNNGCDPAPCHRNDGLADLVSAGCFWPSGHGDPPQSYWSFKCKENYRFQEIIFARLLRDNVPMNTAADVEHMVAQAKFVLRTTHVGLVERYTASLCLWRHSVGLPIRDAQCAELCRGAPRGRQAQEKARRRLLESPHMVTNNESVSYDISNELSPKSLKLIEDAMSTYARVYATAVDLFSSRAMAAEEETGVQLLC